MTAKLAASSGARHDRAAAAILTAAAHVLSEQGSSANMADVAAAAGVSRATLYRYYPHRDALLAALATQALNDTAARLADAGLERAPVDEAIKRIVRAVVTTGDRYAVLVNEQVTIDAAEAQRLLGEPMREVIARGIDSGLLRQDLPVDVLLELFGGALRSAVKLAQRGALGLEEASAAAATLFLDGARPRQRR